MSDQQSNQEPDASDARQEAADYVVERVESWDEGAHPETVRKDLVDGMSEAQVDVGEDELDRMAKEIHDDGSTKTPDVG